MRLITLGIVFGIGYVAGTRAGRQRYEDIRDAAARVRDEPRIQETARKVEDLARETTGRGSDQGASHAGPGSRPGAGTSPAASTSRSGAGSPAAPGGSWPEHPDAHVEESQDELVYTTGPDRVRPTATDHRD